MRVHLPSHHFFIWALHRSRALSVDLVLRFTLELVVRVSENLAILGLLDALWLRKAHVEHVLVVLHEGGVAAELVIESVLRVREHITLVSHSGGVRCAAIGLRNLIILAQVGIEGALAVCWPVIDTKTTRRIADVSVTTTSIVDVNHWLGVNVGEVVHWSLLQELESTYTNTGSQRGAVSQRQSEWRTANVSG